MMRPREPPIAARMAISRRRPVARTSSRLATLAQAISSTKLTAPPSTSSDCRTLLTSTSRIGSDAEAAVRAERVRKLALVVLGGRRDPRLRLLERDARLQPAGRLEVVALVGRVRRELERRPDLRLRPELGEVEFAEDADDRVGLAAERDRFADDVVGRD